MEEVFIRFVIGVTEASIMIESFEACTEFESSLSQYLVSLAAERDLVSFLSSDKNSLHYLSCCLVYGTIQPYLIKLNLRWVFEKFLGPECCKPYLNYL